VGESRGECGENTAVSSAKVTLECLWRSPACLSFMSWSIEPTQARGSRTTAQEQYKGEGKQEKDFLPLSYSKPLVLIWVVAQL
jgi:hypothetical protein